jgi:hypothetical protein
MAKTPSRYEVRRRVARGKRRRGGSTVWYVAVALIVVLFVALIIVARDNNQAKASTRPRVGDHWHTAVGVNVCGTWLPDPPQTATQNINGNETIARVGANPPQYAGLHTHGDGLMHMEPSTADESGANATIGHYFLFNGWSLSQTAFIYSGGISEKNGATCPAKAGKQAYKAVVRWAVGHSKGQGILPGPLVEQHGDAYDYKPGNYDQFALYFVAADANLASFGKNVPSRVCLPNAGAAESGAACNSASTSTSNGATTTTVAGGATTTATGATAPVGTTTTAATTTSKP